MTQDHHQYNGWTNRATWLVPLWIDNEQPIYTMKQDFIRNNEVTPESVKLFVRSLVLTDMLVGMEADMSDNDSDAVGHRFIDVDWVEIAEHWMDEKEEMLS